MIFFYHICNRLDNLRTWWRRRTMFNGNQISENRLLRLICVLVPLRYLVW